MAEYVLTAELIFRGLCLMNLVAFLGFLAQFKGLCGSGGLSPTSEFMKKVRARFPTSVLPPQPFSVSKTKDKKEDSDSDEDEANSDEDEDEQHESEAKKGLLDKPKPSLKDNMNAWYTWHKTLIKNIYSRYYSFPTLFWLSSSDNMHYSVFGAGILASSLGMIGIGWPPLNLLVCYCRFVIYRFMWSVSLGLHSGLQMHVTLLESNMVFIMGTLIAYISWSLHSFFHFTIGYPQFVSSSYSPFVAVFMMRFLVWRIMLGCGACKYGSGDKTWRDLTAMDYHYFTQPLPNPFSYYMAALPHWVHAQAVIGTHLVEGPLTFLAFGPAWCRVIAFICFAGLNLFINITGNYGYLGLLTVVESISVLDDNILRAVLPRMLIPARCNYTIDPSFTLLDLLVIPPLALPYLLTSLIPLISTFHGKLPFYKELIAFIAHRKDSRNADKDNKDAAMSTDAWIAGASDAVLRKNDAGVRKDDAWALRMDAWLRNACTNALRSQTAKKYLFRVLDKCEEWHDYLYPFHFINRYAKFGTMTTKRWEIILEGSDDGEEWREFDFKYKIGNPMKRPVFCPLHLPGMDWQIWFLPTRLATGSRAGWLWKLVECILQNKKDVMALLGPSPFGDKAPRLVRVQLFDYKFCFDERAKEKKQWWTRKYIGGGGGPFTLYEGSMVELRGVQGR